MSTTSGDLNAATNEFGDFGWKLHQAAAALNHANAWHNTICLRPWLVFAADDVKKERWRLSVPACGDLAVIRSCHDRTQKRGYVAA